MGYHDRRPPDYNKTGMTIVNPLHKTQNKLDKIRSVLENISDSSELTANDLKIMIQNVLKED